MDPELAGEDGRGIQKDSPATGRLGFSASGGPEDSLPFLCPLRPDRIPGRPECRARGPCDTLAVLCATGCGL